MGVYYEFGEGKDRAKAKMWYQKAAEQGDEGAIEALERIRTGILVVRKQ